LREGIVKRLDRKALVLALAVLLAAGLAGYAWYADRSGTRREAAGRDCLAASTAAAQAIFSYDYRTFDASVSNAKAFVTGQFATEYAQTTATLKPAAQAQQAVVRAEVSSAGVVSVSGDHVELLLYVNQYRRNAAITGEKVDQNRVVLTMVRSGGTCKVSGASAI